MCVCVCALIPAGGGGVCAVVYSTDQRSAVTIPVSPAQVAGI